MILPEQFVEMINNLAAPQLAGLPEVLSGTPPVVAVRWNSMKLTAPINGLLHVIKEVPWWRWGELLESKQPFTFIPAMHQGLFYVQDPSSMFVGNAIRQLVDRFFDVGKPLACFDMCAAPGGKTTCVLEALPEGSFMLANEMSPLRSAVLAEVIAKHGSPEVVVTRDDAARLGHRLRGVFDIVIADAPCSGEGMMRKEPAAVEQWTPRLVSECARLQESILDAAWSALRPGGVLIYSTCTFNTTENESQLQRLIERYDAEPVALDYDSQWGIAGAVGCEIPCCRFIPGRVEGEGLFMAALRKPTDASSDSVKLRLPKARGGKQDKGVIDETVRRIVSGWLRDGEAFTLSMADEETVRAVRTTHLPIIELIARESNIIQAGIELACLKGKRPQPTQHLALSTQLRRDAFESVEVDEPTALSYLRREALNLPEGTPKGYILLTYSGYPLGFVNNLGNRANNLYPQAWRILKR